MNKLKLEQLKISSFTTALDKESIRILKGVEQSIDFCIPRTEEKKYAVQSVPIINCDQTGCVTCDSVAIQ